jgi:dUTP pyrophosphatase
MEIKIKYEHDDIPRLNKIVQGDWIDLTLDEDIQLDKGQSGLFSLGVCIQLPKGYEAILAPRSSTFKRWGILQANSIGIIDNSYCGNDDIWCFSAYATRDIVIPKGTRICQFRIQKIQEPIIFEEVKYLGSNRGGFGYTGV